MDAERLEQAVEKRLQRDVFVKGEHDVVLTGHVSREPNDTWRVELSLAGYHGQPMGTRTLETQAPDCSSLDDSLALVLAVMLDIPKADIPEPEPPPRPPRAKEAAEGIPKRPVRRSTPLRIPEDTPERRKPWHLEVGMGGVGALGLLPKPSIGLAARALLTPPRFWEVGIELMALRSVDASVGSSNAGANFSPRSVGLWVCPLPFDLDAVQVRGCLVEHLGRLRVEGFGFDENRESTRTFVNAGVRADAFWGLTGPLGVTLTAGLDVPLVRESFGFSDRTGENSKLFRMEPVLGLVQIGVATRFW
jgi:hypothetical protein